jgi:hypothetical protein
MAGWWSIRMRDAENVRLREARMLGWMLQWRYKTASNQDFSHTQ